MANETKPEAVKAAPADLGLQTYKVGQGKDAKEIQASNKREALRRFESGDKRVEAELVKGDEVVPGIVRSSAAGNEIKRRYRITWGPEVREVVAVHKDDAWSQFVGGDENSQAYKYPKTYERIVEDLGPADDSAKGGEVEEAGEDVALDEGEAVSPVADMSAEEAKDAISRMHSTEKLQSIVANDTRTTVQKAAQAKLDSTETK